MAASYYTTNQMMRSIEFALKLRVFIISDNLPPSLRCKFLVTIAIIHFPEITNFIFSPPKYLSFSEFGTTKVSLTKATPRKLVVRCLHYQLYKMKTDEQSTPLNEMFICSICLTTDNMLFSTLF